MINNLLLPTNELVTQYRSGQLIGAYMDADHLPTDIRKQARYEQSEFKNDQPFPRFDAAPKTFVAEDWKGKKAHLWKFWIQADPSKGLMGAQVTGDCVSWGERGKQDVRRCVEFLMLGERERYIERQATCLIYSGRGHTGQGASGSGLANWATKCGILLEVSDFKDSQGKTYDFSNYRDYVNMGIRYGRTGLPKEIIDVTSKNRVVGQSKVRTTNELCDLMLNGYAASVAFSLDTSSRGDPVSRLSGRTAHQTCMVGFDDTDLAHQVCKRSLGYEDTLIFYDQSWGKWNTITNLPEEWKPWGEGMYIHSARDAQRHINEGECIVCTDSILGFKATDIDNLLI